MIDTRDFLDAVSGYTNNTKASTSADRPVRLGTVDPYYTAGLARILFDGETVTSFKGYAWTSGYSPTGGDRVYLIPVGQSYLIGGKVQSALPYNKFYTLTYQNGWRAFDPANYYSVSVSKSPSGVVKVAGLVAGGNAAAGTVIANLPAPFRPMTRQSFPALANTGAAGVDVLINGDICIGSGGSAGWTSLDNITFPTDQSLTWTAPTYTNSWSNYDMGYPTGAFAIDSYNRVWYRGTLKNTTNPTAVNAMFTIPTALRPTKQLHLPIYGASTFAFMDVTSIGEVRWKQGSGSTAYDFIDAVFHHAGSVTGWTDASYTNGWVSNDVNGQPPAGYLKDADGMVYLRGLIRSGSLNTAAFVLPPGYRPSKTYIRQQASLDAVGRLDIAPTGNVTPVSGSNVWFSLDGVSFPAEG